MIRAMLDTVVNALFAMGGVLVVSWVLWDVYQTVVIPRTERQAQALKNAGLEPPLP